MAIRTGVLIEFLKGFHNDAIVRGFEDGFQVKNADGTGEVVVLNEDFTLPAKGHVVQSCLPTRFLN